MAKLKIRGWNTGFNKLRMIEVLTEDLMLAESESKKLIEAVSAGQVITLEIEENDLVESLYSKLEALGVLVDLV